MAVRVRAGRGIARVVLALAVIGGAIAAAPQPDRPLPVAVSLMAAAAVAALEAAIAFGPWDRWSAPAQERVLLLGAAVPVVLSLGAYALSSPRDPDALLMLVVLLLAGTLPLPTPTAVVLSVVTLTIGTVLVATTGEDAQGYLPLVAAALAVAIGHLQARLVGRTLRAAEERRSEAEAAGRSLLAVVDAAQAATEPDPADVLHAVAAATGRLASDVAGVYLLGDDGLLRYGACWNIPAHLRDEAFSPTMGLTGEVMSTGEVVVVDDYDEYAAAARPYREVGLRAAVGAPVRVDGQIVGALVAGRYGPGRYVETEVAAFELLALHAGRALALARSIDEDRTALQQLQRLHELQADFVATVSHELRTPLTVIDGLAETLQLHPDVAPPVRAQLLDRMRANAASLTSIVTDLLERARLDRGLAEVDATPFDLGQLVHECAERLAPLFEDHLLTVQAERALVRGDATLLERVVENLLANAVRHTPPGTHVRLLVQRRGPVVITGVHDDGPGIAPADVPHITQPFRRGGDHHTRSSRGLGLGLALVEQVLRLHSSRLHVASDPGTGASFSFELPVVDDAPR